MDISHYFLGQDILVVTVEHGEMDRRSHIDSAANHYAMELIKGKLARESKFNISLRNYEKKTSAETGDIVSIYTYDLKLPADFLNQKQ